MCKVASLLALLIHLLTCSTPALHFHTVPWLADSCASCLPDVCSVRSQHSWQANLPASGFDHLSLHDSTVQIDISCMVCLVTVVTHDAYVNAIAYLMFTEQDQVHTHRVSLGTSVTMFGFAAGYKFAEQGISLCAVNTSKPIGTTFSVTFMVFDLSIPSKNASVARTVEVISPCSPDQFLCSDGTCSSVTCDVRCV